MMLLKVLNVFLQLYIKPTLANNRL